MNSIINMRQLEYIFLKNKCIMVETVNACLIENLALSNQIMTIFSLNLLKDSFILGIDSEILSGRKRRELREEAVKFVILYNYYQEFKEIYELKLLSQNDAYKLIDLICEEQTK